MNDIVQGTVVRWRALLKNQGNAATPVGTPPYPDGGLGNHRLGFYVDGVLVGWADNYNGPLQPNTTVQMTMNGGPVAQGGGLFDTSGLSVGQHTLRVVADAPLLIPESNEANNEITVTFNITAPVGGATREAMLWPGGPTHPYNVPLHDGISWNMSKSVAGSGDVFRTTSYGTNVYNAGYATLPPTDPEKHRVTIELPAKVRAHDGYGTVGSPYFNDNFGSYDLKSNDCHNEGMGACKYEDAWGIIRQYDYQQGAIRHAINLWLLAGDLRLGWVWPAFGQDGDAAAGGSQHYSGVIPIGTRMGIPQSIIKANAGLQTPEGRMLWDACQIYGCFVTNRSGNRTFQGEATTLMNTFRAAVVNSGDALRCLAQLRMPSGADGSQINTNQRGGPGNPVPGYVAAPPFAY